MSKTQKYIAIVVGILFLIGGGVFVWQQLKGESSGWKTYANEQYGIQIRYPADWEAAFSGNSIEIRNSLGSSLSIVRNPNEKGLVLDEWFRESTIAGGRPTIKANAQPVYINGVKAYKLYSELDAPNPVFEIVGVADSENRIFSVYAYAGQKNDTQILEQILASFKFLK